jgi:hypothetical protein
VKARREQQAEIVNEAYGSSFHELTISLTFESVWQDVDGLKESAHDMLASVHNLEVYIRDTCSIY